MKKNPIFAPPTESAICPTVGGIFIEIKRSVMLVLLMET